MAAPPLNLVPFLSRESLMPAPFLFVTHTVHNVSGRSLDAAISSATGHDFDPVAEGAVPGDDSEGSLKILVHPDASGDNYDLKAYEEFKSSGVAGYPRRVITGYLLTLANKSVIPFGLYQITYTWG